ncbi:MAG: 5-formyltetrahydrofolate cyclo-ligase [Helicobacteraceae bacterium]|jgi:5-formyltetrahydrofolate cyclo-ligase|nr:5-formyltetrahydrofolate cyclo-ligase [Helicobacteraceae bacterium]
MDKNAARAIALERLKARSKALCAAQSAKTRRTLQKLLNTLVFKSVLIYLPLWFEADLRALFRLLRRRAKLYAPYIENVSFKMVAYRLPLDRRSLGVLAPANSLREVKKADLLIVPAVAVDADFKRVGLGKGMYDRFAGKLVKKPIVIFVQPFFLGAPRVSDAFDLEGDYLVGGDKAICKMGDRYGRRTYRRGVNFGRNMRVSRLVYNAQGQYVAAHSANRTGESQSKGD